MHETRLPIAATTLFGSDSVFGAYYPLLVIEVASPTPWGGLSFWGNLASLAGLLVSLVGFAITIWNVRRSKEASLQAELAARGARDRIMAFDTMKELSAATTTMEEIKRLQRAAAWVVLPDRYSSVRKLLGSVQANGLDFSNDDRIVLVGVMGQLAGLEQLIEKAVASEDWPTNVPKLNNMISQQVDKVNSLMAAFRSKHAERSAQNG